MAKRYEDNQRISRELDELSCDVMGEALDRLAEGVSMGVLLAVADVKGQVASYEFADDGEEACLMGARDKVRALSRAHGDASVGLADPQCYALCYEGAIEDAEGSYGDAVIMEFGERGRQAYSAYSLFEGRGAGEAFGWTDPAPAGEVDCLL